MGPLCNLSEFKITDVRLVKIIRLISLIILGVPINVKKEKKNQ